MSGVNYIVENMAKLELELLNKFAKDIGYPSLNVTVDRFIELKRQFNSFIANGGNTEQLEFDLSKYSVSIDSSKLELCRK